MAKHVITPAWQTSRGSIVQAHGCAEGVPVAGARVFGETRQNLWVNPSGTSNGLTATANEDGSITLSGTPTSSNQVNISTYALRPGSTYTVSKDVETTGVHFLIQSYDSGGAFLRNEVAADGWGNIKTFTLHGDAAYVKFGISAAVGQAASGTYRVMLNEGSEAQPWCPPGLSSVSELAVVSAGKNLAAKSSFDGTTKIDCHVEADIPITVSFDAQAAKNYRIYFHDEQGIFSGLNAINITADAPGRVSQTITLTYDSVFVRSYIENGKDEIANLMIEYGSTATAYEPPAVTTPVDLSGHQLRSLPDGTRDVLTVDGSGAVSVEENAMLVSLDGSSDEAWKYDNGGVYAYIVISGRKPVAQTEENTFANLPIYATSAEFLASNTACLYISPTYFNVRSPEGFKSVQDAREWLFDNPVTAVLMRDKPAITQLDPIAPPSIPAADATLWAASDVPCELEATTWTASGAEQGRQQAAMVKVAQQVRQQAETVAALTTQALEA